MELCYDFLKNDEGRKRKEKKIIFWVIVRTTVGREFLCKKADLEYYTQLIRDQMANTGTKSKSSSVIRKIKWVTNSLFSTHSSRNPLAD